LRGLANADACKGWWRWIREAGSDEEANRYRDERRVSVAAVVSQPEARGEFEYRYDIGDGWEHRIVAGSVACSTPKDSI